MSETDQPSTPPILTISEGRALIRLNRPREHNRIEPIDLRTLREHFDQIDRDPSVRVVVITGTGKSFSSGFHIGALADKSAVSSEDRDPDAFEKTVDRLEALGVPTIAAMNGGVYGGSTDLALACDFRIGVPGMRMFMPAAKLGIVYYPSGLRRYVNRLGLAAAKKLFLTAEPIGDDELRAIGYVDEIVPSSHLMTRADEIAGQIAANAPLAVTTLKRALNEIAGNRLDTQRLTAERKAAGASEDHQEALRAWSEKRAPVFKGR